ncbi:protease [Paenibacillus sp. MSJ-34]|uniref:protease n=1 Tax=Paenibacillus sp. MSJ-34 TaxID=2841529 RepID=UPI001C1152AF|nr:protease [Paenibacillus sp. MSJ-34]MBU5442579.1 protease [Paenibacillus sp. MSJ-34]
MITLFWACLAGGALFAVVSVVLGDLMSNALDGLLDFLSVDFLQPMVIASAVTAFGGAGILLDKYTDLGWIAVLALAVIIAVLLGAAVYFGYVKPMANSEVSTGFSLQDLAGKVGRVTVAIPAHGYGEVMVRVGAGNTNQIASSFDAADIPAGAEIVVIDVKESVLRVSQFEIGKGDEQHA